MLIDSCRSSLVSIPDSSHTVPRLGPACISITSEKRLKYWNVWLFQCDRTEQTFKQNSTWSIVQCIVIVLILCSLFIRGDSSCISPGNTSSLHHSILTVALFGCYWFIWFTGSSGSLVHVVHWFMWFTGSCGSLVHWFMWIRHEVNSLSPKRFGSHATLLIITLTTP